MKISYAIPVCNEIKEIERLLEFLIKNKRDEDEIVVVIDEDNGTQEVLDVLEEYSEESISFPFNFQQNFLENKNFMNLKCSGDYIFQIDADEIPEQNLVLGLKTILEHNDVDLLITPRKNLVEGLTQEHIQKWRWNVNEKGWVNWPDAQKRIYRNNPNIKWTGHQVHGMVSGFKTYTTLPFEEQWSIIHNKTIDRQEKQNELYSKL